MGYLARQHFWHDWHSTNMETSKSLLFGCQSQGSEVRLCPRPCDERLVYELVYEMHRQDHLAPEPFLLLEYWCIFFFY